MLGLILGLQGGVTKSPRQFSVECDCGSSVALVSRFTLAWVLISIKVLV